LNKNNEYIVINPDERNFSAYVIRDNDLPLVSFCIPTKNNEFTLENCLLSIASQNYPNLEIIIVDGYSSDNTLAIAKKFTNKIYFEDKKLGLVRQKSIDYSNGLIIALFDSDIIIPHKNWLMNAVKYFNYNNKVSTVWPKNIAPPNCSLMTKLYFNFWKIIIENRIRNRKGFFGGGNSLFLKKSLNDIGRINDELHWGEDFDWAKKLKEQGFMVLYITDPLYHDTMRTFKEFFYKQFTGADTFTEHGFELMGLSTRDILYEHFILGFSGMIKGLLVDRDKSWLYYPFLVYARLYAYVYTILIKWYRDRRIFKNDSKN